MNKSCKSAKYIRRILHECSTTVNYSHVSHIIKIVNPLESLFYAFSRLKLSEIFAFCVNLSAAQIPKNQTQMLWVFFFCSFNFRLFDLTLLPRTLFIRFFFAYECMNINRKLVCCVRIYDSLSYFYLVFIVFGA